MAIAHEGMTGKYGLGIGRVIRENYSHDMLTRMRSLTAAASEARMGGCDMPVVINSGSGNQGIACSVPLIVYARKWSCRTIVCTGRLYFPIFLLCIRNIILANYRHSVVRCLHPVRQEQPSPIW